MGKDQASHVELTREIVRRFNNFFGEVFPEPKELHTEVLVLPGTDGRKMSKSYGNAIYLVDSPDVVREKARMMITDRTRIRRSRSRASGKLRRLPDASFLCRRRRRPTL